MSGRIDELHALGQALWYDNIERGILKNGALAQMITDGDIRGVTSNPSIFKKAIAQTSEYDRALVPLAKKGLDKVGIYEALAVEDIQAAADLFAPLYRESSGGDGYVSMEVSPFLAHDTQGTLKDAKRIWAMVDRPNLMVKIPATKEGLPAITEAIAEGMNINVTLIFSLDRYQEVMQAYLSGLEKRLEQGLPIDGIASVASFFVSRIDTNVDKRLDAIAEAEGSKTSKAAALKGKLAVASAKLAYQEFRKTFNSPRFKALEKRGANIQRPLWASTSTKNPAYPDTLYVDSLIGPHTVNTVPPKTLKAFKDHGTVALTLEQGVEDARSVFAEVEALGVSMAAVTQELEDKGVESFADAFTALLASIEDRRKKSL